MAADADQIGQLRQKAADMLNEGLELADLSVNRNYLINLHNQDPIPPDFGQCSYSYLSVFEIGKIVYDRDEHVIDKLVSVYSALSNFGSAVLLFIMGDKEGVRLCLGTRNTEQPNVAGEILRKSLRGNFPGIEIRPVASERLGRLLERRIPVKYSAKTVSAVSIVPSSRDEDKNRYVQGLEKFIDTMAGEIYTAVFIASPISKTELENIKRGYERLYSALSQYAQLSMTFAESDSEAVAAGMSESFAESVNEGVSETIGKSTGSSVGTSKTRSGGRQFALFGMGHQFGKSSGRNESYSESRSTGRTDTRSETRTESRTSTNTTTTTRGTTSTFAVNVQNKTVQELMEKIDAQLDRIKSCESYGLWECACYFIADKPETAFVAANTFKALAAGEKTNVENSFINHWSGEYEHAQKSMTVMEYLRYGLHPRFRFVARSANHENEPERIVTPASMISGGELPIVFGFPLKSVSGVTSVTSAEFGRNVFVKGGSEQRITLEIGSVYHMGEVFPSNRVRLNADSLTGHCFIAGSTGSGKTNTVLKLIEELISENKASFLVIEPVKGEYKLAFGKMPGIRIFTTNPRYGDMLRLNPFEFHPDIHVLEHLDRLLDVFCACWPLYAAMPALLKAAFERAYTKHGWDLHHSVHIDRGNGKFPTFRDITEILPALLEESEYSAEAKGNYIGALVTRVQSLTAGLLGRIFGERSIEDDVLFDENAIVDLSRVGSAETKALIMGLLILKLTEYRQAASPGMNLPLRHVTILEEAHHLLKRVSGDQSQESANIQGKSVEMIGNSIAEIRTYGEGFIIVDQSPTSVDISAIKNTNTKIIMRLPEADDSRAAGSSIGLNDRQIAELTRLERGVAAVFQNDWQEAVLVKIDRFGGRWETQTFPKSDAEARRRIVGELLEELMTQEQDGQFNMAWLNSVINRPGLSESEKEEMRRLLLVYQQSLRTGARKRAFAELVFRLANCGDLFRIFADKLPPEVRTEKEIFDESYVESCQQWRDLICGHLNLYAELADDKVRHAVFVQLLLHMIVENPRNRRYQMVLKALSPQTVPGKESR